MKKKVSKLCLNRETLSYLSQPQMEGVAGAVPYTYDKSCLLSCFAGCSAVGCTDGCPSQIVRTCLC
ncbi:MAG TPA: class I lanthipeptide [Thermoanaerobaculia bacterium]